MGEFESVCSFTCDAGYVLSTLTASTDLTCNSDGSATDESKGAWSASAPTCEAITCPALPKGTGVESILDSGDSSDCTTRRNAYDTTCDLLCSTGYVPLTGATNAETGICGEADSISTEGKFSKDLGCEQITCPAVSLASDTNVEKFVADIGGVEKDCQTEDLPYGTKCVLSCKSGWIADTTTPGYADTVTCGENVGTPKSASGQYSDLVKCIAEIP